MQNKLVKVFLVLLTIFPLAAIAQSPFDPANTDRVSFGTFSGATEPTGPSSVGQISKNGRFVVFESTAGNLVDQTLFTTTPGRRHVYLKDRQANSVELISVGPYDPNSLKYTEPSQNCLHGAVSADGRYVSFATMSPAIDFDASPHLFLSGLHVYVRDRLADRTFLGSMVNQPAKLQKKASGVPIVSVTKRCKTYPATCNEDNPAEMENIVSPEMEVKNLWIAAFDGYPDETDPSFVPSLNDNPYLSYDGKFFAIESTATNLAGIVEPLTFIEPIEGIDYNQDLNNNNIIDRDDPLENDGIIDGPRLVFPAYFSIFDLETTDHVKDIYVRDGSSNTFKIVSLSCKYHDPFKCGIQGDTDATNPQVSDDGRFVTFQTASPLLDLDFNKTQDIFYMEYEDIYTDVGNLRRISNDTSRLLAANSASTSPALSADGRYVAFQSGATNIVTGDTNARSDIFVYDTKFFTSIRCLATGGTQGNGDSSTPSISGSGEYVAFHGNSTNWGATSGLQNVYVGSLTKDALGRIASCTIQLASRGPNGTGGNGDSTNASIGVMPKAQNGTTSRVQVPAITYTTSATNIGSSSDTNGVSDIYEAPKCSAAELAIDTDGDGTSDCFDQCHRDILKVTDIDSDADGYADCEDGCPGDPQKATPAVCGCGATETDSDSDGTPDCNDKCPNDANKTEPKDCGCGLPETDANNNGVKDCKETSTPGTTPTATPTVNPSLAATPTPTVAPSGAPTAGPTPDITGTNPGTIQLKRVEGKIFQIRLTLAQFPIQIASYRVELQRKKNKATSTRTLTLTDNVLTLRKSKPGKYKARFKAIGANGQSTPFSAYSKVLIVR